MRITNGVGTVPLSYFEVRASVPRTEMLQVTPLMKRLLKNLLTALLVTDIYLEVCIQLFQKTLSEEKKKVFKPRP